MTSSDTQARLARLSSEKRALILAALREKAAQAEQASTIPRRTTDAPTALSFAQQRLWFADQVETSGSSYNVATGLHIQGQLNVAALEKSLNEIVRRHEALRTTFPTVDGDPVQVVNPAYTLDLPVVDLETLPVDERESTARRLASAEAQRRFDLATGPLIAACLFRLAADEHLFALTVHHIVSDGWSLGVLFQELATLYRAAVRGTASPLPELPIQYGDFAAWQRQWLQGPVLDDQRAYWQQTLAGAPTTIELPTDRPRPPIQTFAGSVTTFDLPPALSARLEALSRHHDVTLFMTLLAAFQTLLLRYTGQDELIVGSPIANRTRPETEKLIGFFVNTLVLRGDLSGNPTFRELLWRAREATLGAYAHQDLPFERLVEALQRERDLSRHPLFQVMFALQNAPMEPPRLSNLAVRVVDLETVTSPFDLTLLLEESTGGLKGLLEYNTDLFDAKTIARLIGHFETLLAGIVADPDCRLSDLPLLTPAERHQLADWNVTTTPYPAGRCLHELVEAQVERTPDAVAVQFGDAELSYRELNARANQLAHYLRRLGVGPEVRVGICVERSLEQMIGLLGVLKAGGAYLPLDPTYPAERLAYMLEDAGTPVVLTQQHLRSVLPTHAARVLCLDTEWDLVRPASTANPGLVTVPESAAYVIYTSGSTGRPKGVIVPHRGLVNHSAAIGRLYELVPGDRVLQFASMSFDVMGEEVYPTWASGATLVLRPDDVATSFGRLLELVERERLTVLNLPIPYWHEWVAELARSGDALPTSLRLVVSGSEKALAERLTLWQRAVGDRVRWLNAYGPTEATITTTTYEPRGPEAGTSVPIGRPIGNSQAYLLDAHLRPVPVGVPGELYIGGINVARGYLGRPDLTAERFIPDPFSPTLGSRLYRTGDRARFLPSGAIEFLGRFDFQVKLRGFRIELGEIEAALAAHPAVRDSVIVVHESGSAGPRLVAYVVADAFGVDLDRLRGHLEECLPAYMVPTAFVILETLPLSPNGKLDRRALPAPDTAPTASGATFIAPQTATERAIASIWQEVLGEPRVGLHDNFFDLGGHSLLLARVHAELRRQLGTSLTLIDLFKHPTVSALARALIVPQPTATPTQQVQDRASNRRDLLERQRQLRQRSRVT